MDENFENMQQQQAFTSSRSSSSEHQARYNESTSVTVIPSPVATRLFQFCQDQQPTLSQYQLDSDQAELAPFTLSSTLVDAQTEAHGQNRRGDDNGSSCEGAVHPMGLMTSFDGELQEQGSVGYQHGLHSIPHTAIQNQTMDVEDSSSTSHLTSSQRHSHTKQSRVQKRRLPLSERTTNNAYSQLPRRTAPSHDTLPASSHAALPDGVRYMFAGAECETIVGVKASRVIEMGEKFGPYTGTLLVEEEAGVQLGSTWEICVRGKVRHYVDGTSKIHNNWLFHINVANTREEQNLEAFQSYGDIYFRALDTIQPGTELRVFYCKEYRQKIGCDVGLEDLDYDRENGDFTCRTCHAQYTSSKIMIRHLKFAHREEESTAKYSSAIVAEEGNRQTIQPTLDREHNIITEMSQSMKRASTGYPYNISDSDSCDDQLDHVCNVCDKGFSSAGKLMLHQKFHESTIKEYRCQLCDFVCTSFQTSIRHKSVHNKKSFTCELCGNVYRFKAGCMRHLKNGHGIKTVRGVFVCDCGERFEQIRSFLKHGDTCEQQVVDNIASEDKERDGDDDDDDGDTMDHEQDDPGETSETDLDGQCIATLFKYGRIERGTIAHSSKANSSDLPDIPKDVAHLDFNSQHDSILSNSSNKLYKYITEEAKRQKMSTDQPPLKEGYECKHCDKIFSSNGRLNAHQQFHQFYSCQECNFHCKKHKDLLHHENTHFQTVHTCELCGNIYRWKHGLNKHLKRWHGIQMTGGEYLCGCGKLFKKANKFQQHEQKCELKKAKE